MADRATSKRNRRKRKPYEEIDEEDAPPTKKLPPRPRKDADDLFKPLTESSDEEDDQELNNTAKAHLGPVAGHEQPTPAKQPKGTVPQSLDVRNASLPDSFATPATAVNSDSPKKARAKLAKNNRIKNAATRALPDKENSPIKRQQEKDVHSKADWTAKAVPLSKDRVRAIEAGRSSVFGMNHTMKAEMAKPETAINALKIPIDGSLKQIGRHPTAFLHQFFDEQRNDYGPHAYEIDSSIELHYRGPAFDRPKDIRARSFIVMWKNGERPPKIDDKEVVMRVTMTCMGNCTEAGSHDETCDDDFVPQNATEHNEEEQDTDGSPPWSDMDVDEHSKLTGGGRKGGRPKKHRRKCNVRLIVDVHAEDLSHAIVYRLHEHGPCARENLAPSLFVRHGIRECASQGMTSAKIKRILTSTYIDNRVPVFRRHTSRQVDSIVKNERKAQRIDTNPLKCLGVFARHNPECVYHFSKPDSSRDQPSSFAAGLKSDFSLQSLILYSHKYGCGLDSCYRNKNENRAPLTFLTTVNDAQRMLPGAVYLSSDIKASTIAEFLEKTKEVVEKHAKDLVDGRAQVCEGYRDRASDVLREARYIVQHGWRPKFIMIDKSRANMKGILKVWPDMSVRICQFHIIQAIIRWDRDAKGDKHQVSPRLSLGRKHLLLRAVREVQRCRLVSEWPKHVGQFHERLDIVLNGCKVPKQTVTAYFEANWFMDEWRDSWTDIGLPDNEYREGVLSTNNWTERAFKTFDQVFLDRRANKSIFRLVLIIVNEWFPYYEMWQDNKPAPSNRKFDAVRRGYLTWSTKGAVQYIDLKGNWHRFIVADIY